MYITLIIVTDFIFILNFFLKVVIPIIGINKSKSVTNEISKPVLLNLDRLIIYVMIPTAEAKINERLMI